MDYIDIKNSYNNPIKSLFFSFLFLILVILSIPYIFIVLLVSFFISIFNVFKGKNK